MKMHGAYYICRGFLKAETRDVDVTGQFQFNLSIKGDPADVAFFVDNENREGVEMAVAAINGDLAELRRLLDSAAPVPVEGDAA